MTPRRVDALAGVRVRWVAAGAFHSAAIDDEGVLYTWGRGDSGQLGTGLANHECAPQRLDGIRHVARAALGFAHSLAASAHGPAATWGADDGGCLGQGFAWPRPPARAPKRLGVRLAEVAAG